MFKLPVWTYGALVVELRSPGAGIQAPQAGFPRRGGLKKGVTQRCGVIILTAMRTKVTGMEVEGRRSPSPHCCGCGLDGGREAFFFDDLDQWYGRVISGRHPYVRGKAGMFFKKKEGVARFKRYLGARYHTMNYCFDKFIKGGGKTVVELGTSRSFVGGKIEGCMINDVKYWKPHKVKNWDWGAGLFTLMCSIALCKHNPEIHTVDISPDAIEISKVITSDYSHLIKYHCMSSHEFLSTFEKKADLVYMDAGDSEDAAQLHLVDAQIILGRDLLAPGGTILVDDFNIPGKTDSKGKLSVPFFCRNGFEIKISGYQAVLEKSSSLS